MAASVTSTFITTGMHCHSCSMLIQMTVGDLDGVESVVADNAAGMTEVTYDPDKVSPQMVIDEIVKAGYGAESAV